MKDLYSSILQIEHDLQYESILNAATEERMANTATRLMSDKMYVHDIKANTATWSEFEFRTYFDTRKIESDVKKLRKTTPGWKKNKVELSPRSGEDLVPLVELILNLPTLGYEENLVSTLRRYVRKDYEVVCMGSQEYNHSTAYLIYLKNDSKKDSKKVLAMEIDFKNL